MATENKFEKMGDEERMEQEDILLLEEKGETKYHFYPSLVPVVLLVMWFLFIHPALWVCGMDDTEVLPIIINSWRWLRVACYFFMICGPVFAFFEWATMAEILRIREQTQDENDCKDSKLPPGLKQETIYHDTSKSPNYTAWYAFNPRRIASDDEMVKVSKALSKVVEWKQIEFRVGICRVEIESIDIVYDFETLPKVVETWPAVYTLQKEGDCPEYDGV